MITCHCKAVTSKEIRKSILQGAKSVEAIGHACGAGSECQGCLPLIEDLLATAPPRVVAGSPTRNAPSGT